MQATMLDLRRNPRAILEALDRNETVTLTVRGHKRGTIVPASSSHHPKHADQIKKHPAFGLWADRKEMQDVASYVRKLRQGRMHAV